MAQWCNPRPLQPEQSGGVGSKPGRTLYCICLFKFEVNMRVLWRSGVILGACSHNSQAEWVRNPVGPHHLGVITQGMKSISSAHTTFRDLLLSVSLLIQ